MSLYIELVILLIIIVIINMYIALFFEVTQRAEILYIIDNIILQLLPIVHVTDYNQYPGNISSRCIS